MWDNEDFYYSGQGVVMLAERDAQGAPMGFLPIGNVPDLKLSISTSVLEHKESKTGQRSTDMRLNQETKCALSMTLENFSANNLALASRGLVSTVTAASVNDELVKAYLGKVIALQHIQVSQVVVMFGATMLTEGVDYWVNQAAGSIKLADTITGLADGATLSVDYTFSNQRVISSLTQSGREFYLRFEGLNTVNDNSPVVVEVFKFSADPFKELALIGDNVQSFVLEGSVLSDAARATGSKFFKTTILN